MKQIFPLKFWKNGTCLVASMMLLGVIAASLTIWVYSQHVYSSGEAHLISSSGEIDALYSQRLAKKIFPHQIARVTFQQGDFFVAYKAEVIAAQPTLLKKKQILLVKLQLLEREGRKSSDILKNEQELSLGRRCSVTIDTTIPMLQ